MPAPVFDHDWRVGDRYYIGPSSSPTWGEIYRIDEEGYHIQWEDGTTTVEEEPDPSDSFWGRKGYT